MCGIIGEFGGHYSKSEFLARRDSLAHRGPDAAGDFISTDGRLRFGHRRLSIIDLSERGNQPMAIDGRVIVYNGEIYNFKELRREIGGDWRSNTDTEVILRGYIRDGLKFFERLDGMFALAIYDPEANRIVLARDRAGIKPLYYSLHGGALQFASEPQAIKTERKINARAVSRFLAAGYLYGPETIYEGILKLPPASCGIFNIRNNSFEINRYADLPKIDEINTFAEANEKIVPILERCVASSLISDVPLGVALSSGIDSALIASLAAKSAGKIKTFTVAFEFASFDESKNAAEIARILGTDHHTITLDRKEVIERIPDIIDAFHEPFGDSSAIPYYFLSKFMRTRVTVGLSGDGADELFGGYPLYYLPSFGRFYRWLPGKNIIRRAVAALPASFEKMSWDYKLKRFVHGFDREFRKAHFFYRAMHNGGVIKDDFLETAWQDFKSHFGGLADLSPADQLMRLDERTILEGDYLVKADRMSMAHGLEMRVPFLMNALLIAGHALNPNLKVRGLTTKYILKKILESYLPKRLIYARKKGFSVPMAFWLRGALKGFMLDTLSTDNLSRISILNPSRIQEMIKHHLQGRKDYNRELWGLVSLVRFLNKLG